MAILAITVGLYPTIYFIINRKFGLLQTKSDALLNNLFWNIEFYTHIILGGVALLIGWIQFIKKYREKNLNVHRILGKVYLITSLLSAVAGIYIALFATGGFISSLGFMCLGIIWFYSTSKAFIEIKKGRIEQHRKMMIYSYAACFSAVTLRVYLPLLIMFFHDFNKAYVIVSWLCWVPNIVVAYLITTKNTNDDGVALDKNAIKGISV